PVTGVQTCALPIYHPVLGLAVGRKAGRARPCGRPPDQELGGPGASGRREGAEGSRSVDRRTGSSQQGIAETPGSAVGGLGGLQQSQSTVGRQGLSRG